MRNNVQTDFESHAKRQVSLSKKEVMKAGYALIVFTLGVASSALAREGSPETIDDVDAVMNRIYGARPKAARRSIQDALLHKHDDGVDRLFEKGSRINESHVSDFDPRRAEEEEVEEEEEEEEEVEEEEEEEVEEEEPATVASGDVPEDNNPTLAPSTDTSINARAASP